MNPCIPDWNLEAEFSIPSQKKPFRLDDGLVELLWQNGQVVLHSQTNRKSSCDDHDESTIRTNNSGDNRSNLIQENEKLPWLHFPVDDDDDPFCSNFLSEISTADEVEANDQPVQHFDAGSDVNRVVPSSDDFGFRGDNPLPPPKFRAFDSTPVADLDDIAKKVEFHSPGKNGYGDQSHCGSNQVVIDCDTSRVSTSGFGKKGLSASVVNNNVRKISPQNEKGEMETLETAITSSSGGSGSSFGKFCGHKRKQSRDVEESECQSEEAALQSAEGNKRTQKSGTSRRTRAAEVHNLSERRRRDRINEKMRTLQELIPHSNKSDKASMLDEAIEYMKSLQLQLQMMWMGSGMAAPMMFPGVQHYMSRMGMGMAPPTMPPQMHNPMHLPRLPMVDQAALSIAQTQNQAAVCQNSLMNAVNMQNQLQNVNLSDQYGRFLGFHPLQNASQQMNMFNFAPNAGQQNSMFGQHNHSNGPSTG